MSEPANSLYVSATLSSRYTSLSRKNIASPRFSLYSALQVKPSLKSHHGYCLLSLTPSPRGQLDGKKVARHWCPHVVRRNGCEANTGAQPGCCSTKWPLGQDWFSGQLAHNVSKPSQPPAPIRSGQHAAPHLVRMLSASNFQCLRCFSLLFLRDVVTYDYD